MPAVIGVRVVVSAMPWGAVSARVDLSLSLTAQQIVMKVITYSITHCDTTELYQYCYGMIVYLFLLIYL